MDELALCAVIRNEARFLHEWLSYHYAQGVRRFVLYDNASTDDPRAVLAGWARRDLVTLVDWPQPDAKLRAYADMVVRFRLLAEWCGFIDCDEFLVPQGAAGLCDVVRAAGREANGLYVHRYAFGSAGHLARQPGLVTETFRWRAPDGFGAHFLGKSIVRLGALTHVGLHVCRCSGRMVNDAGWEIDQLSPGAQVQKSHRTLALNHYATKSRAEWSERRAAGGGGVAETFAQHDVNAEQDDRAALFMQAARALFYLPPVRPEVVRLASPAALLSAHGTLLCWDAAASRVVHRAPPDLGRAAAPLLAEFAPTGGGQCVLAKPVDGVSAFTLLVAGHGPLVNLRGPAGFVSALAGSDAVHAQAAAAGGWEMFLPLGPADANRLAGLASGEVRLEAGFLLLLGQDRYDLRWGVPRARLAATAAPSPPAPLPPASPPPAPLPPSPPSGRKAGALPFYDLSDEPAAAAATTQRIGPALARLREAGRVETVAVLSPAARLMRAPPFFASPAGAAAAPYAGLFLQPDYRSYAVDALACCALPRAGVLAPDGLIWFDGALLWDSARSLEPWRAEAWAAESVAGDASALRLKRAMSLPSPRPGAFFCGFIGAWRNYAHWISECLPRLVAYRTLRARHPELRLLLPRLAEGSAQAQTVRLLGIDAADIVTLADGEVFAGALWTTGAIDVWSLPAFCREAAGALAEAALADAALADAALADAALADAALADPDAAPDAGRRIYVRRGVDSRRMVDLPGLQPMLDRHGFRVVTLQDMSLAQQARTMRRARWIIGECGAALANIMFCEPGARVLELFNEAWAHPAHWTLASLCGLDYGFLEGRHVASAGSPEPSHNADYIVTPQGLEPALHALLAGGRVGRNPGAAPSADNFA